MRFAVVSAVLALSGCAGDPTCQAIRDGVARHEVAAAPCDGKPQRYDDAKCEAALAPCTDADRDTIATMFSCEIRWCDGDKTHPDRQKDMLSCGGRILSTTEACRTALDGLKSP